MAAHVDALRSHGVEPDVVLVDPDALAIGPLDNVSVLARRLAGTDMRLHDPERMAAALRELHH